MDAEKRHRGEEGERPRQQGVDARASQPEKEHAEERQEPGGGDRDARIGVPPFEREQCEHGAAVDGDEYSERRERTEVLADEVLVAAKSPRQNGEDRLSLELIVERRGAEDDRDEDRVERDRGGAQVADDAALLVERERPDDERVRGGRQRDAEEAVQNPRPHRFAVRVQRDGGDSRQHGFIVVADCAVAPSSARVLGPDDDLDARADGDLDLPSVVWRSPSIV